MATSTEVRRRRAAAALLVALGLAGCGSEPEGSAAESGAESWSVTVWGEHFEVFPEVDPLMAGQTAVAHTHVTRLDGFTPVTDGRVDVVLAGPAGEEVFTATEPARPGIFAVEIAPESPGERDLLFRVRAGGSSEEIRGGRVRVGTAQDPGRVVTARAPRGASDAGEPLTFLKEEQWRSDFATAWVRPGRMAGSVSGMARVRAPAGAETTVTAPVDGVVRPVPGARGWPYVGLYVERGRPLFQVVPHVASERSLPTLESELATLDAELESARARLGRLEELLALEAASRREVEEARVRVESLTARRAAAAQDLRSARSAREGGGTEGGLILRAPFGGQVARVSSSPGTTVAAGEPLARVVRTDAFWLELALAPADAQRIAAEGVRGVVLSDPERSPVRIEEGLELVSVAPEMSPETGTVTALLQVPPTPGLTLGTTVEAQVLSGQEREGIVIPATAVVDDGGVDVVYLQLSGESFVRQEVHVLERQGDRLLVDRLMPGQRLVTRGGDAIRRASLMAGGEAHGHVH